MKRILFPSILIATVLAGGLLAYAIWKAPRGTAEDFLQSGKKYYEQKKYPEAEIQFLNAIQKDSRNRDARYFLARSYIGERNFNAAAKELNALLEYFPDDVEANLELGNLYLTGGGTDPKFLTEASNIAKKLLAKEPDNIRALILLGNASVGLQDYASSADLFEKVISLDPQNVSAFVSLGTTRVLLKNYPEAEQAFLKAREVNPKDRSALVSLANYYRAVGDPTKAEALLKEALSIYPGDRSIYVQLVQFYFQFGRFEEAEKLLRDVQAQSPKDPAPSLILVDLYQATNRTPDARKLLLDLKSGFPQNLDIAAKLAMTFIQDDPVRARGEIDQIIKAEPKSAIGHILLGELQFVSGQYAEAETTFATEPAINSSRPQPHYFLGDLASRKGQVDQAQDHYQKSLAIDSQYLPARVALAEVFVKKGRLADAREEIRKVLAVRPNFVQARLLKAAVDRSEKKYAEAEQELAALIKEQPDNPLIQRQMGLYYDSRGRAADAGKYLARAYELQPNSEEILQELTQFYIREKQVDRAIQTINAVPDDKKQAFHYEILGLAYFQTGKFQESESAYKKARDKDPSRSNSDYYLAVQYMNTGRFDEALKELDQLITKKPTDPSPAATKGTIFQKQGKLEQAKQSYDQALKVDPNYGVAANNLAYILAEEGRDLQTALGWAQIARKRLPESSNPADTLGWIYYKLGNHVLARDQLKFAVSKEPNNAVYQYHLGMIYKETKQFAEAETALKKALSSPNNFKEKPLAEAALKDVVSIK
jgi:tetratricopeptide (TPR) repeat protein